MVRLIKTRTFDTAMAFSDLLHNIRMDLNSDEYRKIDSDMRKLSNGIKELIYGRWNTEENPEEDGDYIVIWQRKDDSSKWYALAEFCDGEWDFKEHKIIAWMELPPLPEI